jgi:hypothetical protein
MAAPSDTTGSGPVPAGEVIEVDGLLWKPKSGATSSGEQFSRARSLLLEIHRDASWNPWVEEDRTQENQQATKPRRWQWVADARQFLRPSGRAPTSLFASFTIEVKRVGCPR